MAGGGMSRLASVSHSVIEGRMHTHGSSRATGLGAVLEQTGLLIAAAELGTVVRPGRVRNRTKAEPDEKLKKPAEGVRKKSPPARKTPARGRYVDEYASPAC